MTQVKGDDVFKELVWDVVVRAILAKVFLAVPALGWGPFGIVISWLIDTFTDEIYRSLKHSLVLEEIRFANEEHKRVFNKSIVVLRIIAREKGSDSKEFQNAKAEAKNALSRFVRIAA